MADPTTPSDPSASSTPEPTIDAAPADAALTDAALTDASVPPEATLTTPLPGADPDGLDGVSPSPLLPSLPTTVLMPWRR